MILALILLLLLVAIVAFHFLSPWNLLPQASNWGQIDDSFNLTMVIATSTIMLSVGFAAAVGLIFGIYPAWQASSLRPIEALRYE